VLSLKKKSKAATLPLPLQEAVFEKFDETPFKKQSNVATTECTQCYSESSVHIKYLRNYPNICVKRVVLSLVPLSFVTVFAVFKAFCKCVEAVSVLYRIILQLQQGHYMCTVQFISYCRQLVLGLNVPFSG
jgi:hypothetical protein